MSKTQINKGISLVFEEIQKTIDAVGERGFIKMLVELREDNQLTYQNEIAKVIIKIVAKEFDLSVKELLYGSQRMNDKTHALGIITLLLMNEFNFLLKEVSFVLNKNNTNLSRYKSEVENYDENHPLDMKRIEKLESIKHQLKLYKKHYEQTR
jgi:DNA repair ATPase RecN|tara:strand:- start:13941 stop:14399 length:459 start_codon:yes stop_codon:yes gene_type:complete